MCLLFSCVSMHGWPVVPGGEYSVVRCASHKQEWEPQHGRQEHSQQNQWWGWENSEILWLKKGRKGLWKEKTRKRVLLATCSKNAHEVNMKPNPVNFSFEFRLCVGIMRWKLFVLTVNYFTYLYEKLEFCPMYKAIRILGV